MSGKLAEDFQAAVTGKNYAEQIRLGKQLVAAPSNADNAVIYIIMAGAGLGDANQLNDSAQAAKKAIELIEGGKPFTPAYQTKDQALAAMNYVIAKSLMKTPNDAIPYFVKALRYESDLKKSPVVYNELATAYGEGPVDKFAKDYKTLADAGKPVDSPEIKLVVANLNQAFDGQIDAFARAAAVSTNAADKKAIMDVLAAVYKDRNKTEPTPDQLNTLVASALSKPVPDAPKQITELPAGSATPTSGSGNGSTTAAGGAPTGSPKPTGTAPTSSTSTKPATSGSTTPAKPTATPRPRQR
jgi:type IV secretory pathway VirJ component